MIELIRLIPGQSQHLDMEVGEELTREFTKGERKRGRREHKMLSGEQPDSK